MNEYFMKFQVFGEVADFLLLKKPHRRLLIDISTDPARQVENGQRMHPSRTTFTILEPEQIESFLATMAKGDLIEATGSFSQSNYVPQKTSYVDTTFLLTSFHKLGKNRYTLSYRGQNLEPAANAMMH